MMKDHTILCSTGFIMKGDTLNLYHSLADITDVQFTLENRDPVRCCDTIHRLGFAEHEPLEGTGCDGPKVVGSGKRLEELEARHLRGGGKNTGFDV